LLDISANITYTEKVLNLLAKQKEYKASLFNSVEEVKKRTARIKDEAAQCLAARQEKMHRTIDETNGKMDDAAKVLQMMYVMLYEQVSLNEKYSKFSTLSVYKSRNVRTNRWK